MGVGKLPLFPGTWGSLVGLAASWFLIPYGWKGALVLLGIFVLGAFAARVVEQKHGEDARIIVIDEIMGMGVSLLWIQQCLSCYLAAFVLFRIFDIFKPFPARQAEAIPGGWGVMVDDLVAGIYANIGVRILVWVGDKF